MRISMRIFFALLGKAFWVTANCNCKSGAYIGNCSCSNQLLQLQNGYIYRLQLQ